jgi:hypothetical protein
MRVYSDEAIATLRALAAHGHSAISIAAKINRLYAINVTPLSVRVKCCSLGVPLRAGKAPKQFRVLLRLDTRTILQKHAAERGVNAAKLAAQLLTVIVADGLVAAVLDVPLEKAEPRRNGASVNAAAP